MKAKLYICAYLLLHGVLPSQAQNRNSCALAIQGTVRDVKSGESLPGATVSLLETGKGTATDERGNFVLENICPGSYTIICRFEGFAADTSKVMLTRSTKMNFSLTETSRELQSVTIQAEKEVRPLITQNVGSIEGHELETKRGFSLAESLKGITGVYTLQTGPTISKPVIHGLYNNRVLILNNGIRQEGQQWGNEHAPEIDPFIARRLSVVKGAASIRYGSDAIGGVVLVEPSALPVKKGIAGEINLIGATNGRMGITSGMLEGMFGKKLDGLSWRVQGSFRKGGNAKTPDYFLENTGMIEGAYSGALAYRKSGFGADVYYSHYDAKLGIFSGSYAETIGDIQRAIERPEPITPSYFSYYFDRPYQKAVHDLIKANAFVNLPNGGKLEAVFARQENQRSEYSYVPLSGRENPELYLQLTTHTLDVTWSHAPVNGFSGNAGVSGITQGNIRDFQYLIPNYRNYGGGVFAIERWTKNKLALEAGLRYDYRWLRAYFYDGATGNRVEPTYIFNNITGTFGAVYDFSDKLSVQGNIGTAWRPPSANELFSDGVHQSAASYEKGNPNLTLEQAFNSSLAIHYHTQRVHVELETYQNIINNYIYLKPDLTFVRTARGSYPSYTYTPANVVFRGIDASFRYYFTPALSFSTKASLVWAFNKTIDDYLIFTPPFRIDNSLRYEWTKIGKLTGVYVALTNLNVAHQNRVPPNSDYAPPPPGYVLVGSEAGFSLPWKSQPLTFSVSVSNMFNTSYRDYLNRFRYFADDLGTNVVFRIKVPLELTTKN